MSLEVRTVIASALTIGVLVVCITPVVQANPSFDGFGSPDGRRGQHTPRSRALDSDDSSPSYVGPSAAENITNKILTNRSANCEDYVDHYKTSVKDLNSRQRVKGYFSVQMLGGKCGFITNAIPNHDMNDGRRGFRHAVSTQNAQYEITTNPRFASRLTPISLRMDNAILLNGVKVDLLAAACYGVGNERIGCNDVNQPWRLDPMFTTNGFGTDSHNAHTQPDGSYHYHGNPNALFEMDTSYDSPVIGFAADGFPIYGSMVSKNGSVRQAKSSFRLKQGQRPTGKGHPGGRYDGRYRDDYEYVEGIGDLDECNGMVYESQYGYYITESFPYIMSCFKGTPDRSFNKQRTERHRH